MGRRRTPEYDISPDPVYHFVNFVGELFSWGLAGGSALYFMDSIRGSPSGGARLAGAINAVRQNAPRVAGRFGAYTAFLAAIESAMAHGRGREDTWNGIAAVAATWGLHGMCRAGAAAAARGALLGAIGFLGLDYGIRVWEIGQYCHHDDQINYGLPVPAPDVVRRPEAGRGPPRWLMRMSPFATNNN